MICHRCGTLLTPGRGAFYIVELRAYAENSSPVITLEDLARDHQEEMQKIAAELTDISPQEMMDQVHRHMTFFLCRPCYQQWIENPTP